MVLRATPEFWAVRILRFKAGRETEEGNTIHMENPEQQEDGTYFAAHSVWSKSKRLSRTGRQM
jgi:hypothetical protein